MSRALPEDKGTQAGGRVSPGRKRLFVRVVVAVIVALTFLVGGQHLLARPDLRGFAPAELGRVESAMWRSYYEGHWFRLGGQTLELACGQYRFSWWDGVRVATHTALAAAHFRKDTNDPRSLPQLERYYRIVNRAVPGHFEVAEAARLELAWWRERRMKVPTHEYAKTMAKLAALTYHLSEEDALPASLLRAEAMAYRDARRDGRMTEADWSELTRQLRAAYAEFQAKILSREPSTP